MFLYKCDVSALHAVNPQRMARVVRESGASAAAAIQAAAYGVVLQVDGLIVGVLPVREAEGGPVVTGAFSAHQRTEHVHSDVVREMLEMLVTELEAPAASAEVLADDVRVFEQCGFVACGAADAAAGSPQLTRMVHTRP